MGFCIRFLIFDGSVSYVPVMSTRHKCHAISHVLTRPLQQLCVGKVEIPFRQTRGDGKRSNWQFSASFCLPLYEPDPNHPRIMQGGAEAEQRW